MKTHNEHEHLDKHFDESVSNFIGRPMGGMRVVGAGGHLPLGGVTAHRSAALTPEQRHLNMVRRFYRHNPQPIRFNRSFRLSPLAIRWMGGGGGFLFGYPYEIIYPIFNEVNSGIYNENDLRSRFEFSDEQWNDLMLKLSNAGYLISY